MTGQEIWLKAKQWLPLLLLGLLVYFGSIEVNSYLGRQALAESSLTRYSLDEALARARAENKLVLADIAAIWCTACRKLDKKVFSDASVLKAIDERFVFARIEYESEEGEAFIERYDVLGYPTLLILDADGNKLSQLPVTFSPQAFVELLTRS